MTGDAARHRICFVLPSLHGGGAERAAVQVLNALNPGVWDRSMYLFERSGPYLSEVAGDVAIASGAAGASRMGRWNALRRYIRERRPDVIVSFLSYFSVLTAARAAATGARVVFNQQTPLSAFLSDPDYHWHRPTHRRVFALVTRIGYRLADAIVTTSAGVRDDLVAAFGLDANRIRVVHNPVDLDAVAAAAAEPLDPDVEARWTQPVLVAAGRLAAAKNYPLLIDAMAMLRRHVAARLFILGQGELERQIRDQVTRLGLQNAVVLAGFQNNPWKYIARADAFVLTSHYEGFGNVLVEAMACGIPVVATSSPGTRAIVADGENGLLVERHEAKLLAAALERMVTDRVMHDGMSRTARQTAERFALPAIAAEFDRVLSEVLA